jgi:hypothetical protein
MADVEAPARDFERVSEMDEFSVGCVPDIEVCFCGIGEGGEWGASLTPLFFSCSTLGHSSQACQMRWVHERGDTHLLSAARR